MGETGKMFAAPIVLTVLVDCQGKPLIAKEDPEYEKRIILETGQSHQALSSPSPLSLPSPVELLCELIHEGAFVKPNGKRFKYRCIAGAKVCMEGLIGVGKSWAGKHLKSVLLEVGMKSEFYEEEAEEHLLTLFYTNPPKYAFALQLKMYEACLRNFKLAERRDNDMTVRFIDRSLWGNEVFAAMHTHEGNISTPEWAAYKGGFKSNGPYAADFVVFLVAKVARCMERAKQKRGRKSEKDLPLEYMQNLERWYTTMMLAQIKEKASNIVPIDWNEFGTPEDILNALVKYNPDEPYEVTGDLNVAFNATEDERADMLRELMSTHALDLDSHVK